VDRGTFFPLQMCVRFRGGVEAGEGGSQELFIFIAKPPLYCFYFHLLVSLRKLKFGRGRMEEKKGGKE